MSDGHSTASILPYSPKAVANYFLQRSFDEGIHLSPMKLQKLLYYAQGWHLGFTGQPLIDEQVECWDFGPVFSSIFHHFKEFGGDPIDRFAVNRKLVRSDKGLRITKWEPMLPSDLDEDTSEILDIVWESYKRFSAVRLSNMTHATGSPWSVVYKKHRGNPPKGTDIPMSLMRRHFKSKLEKSD